MTAEHWQRVKEIFASVVDRPAAERAALVATSCAGDHGLEAEVVSLLAAHDQATSQFLADPLLGPAQPSAGSPPRAEAALPRSFADGEVIAGRYRIVSFIAQGGMGEVYQAVDLELGGHVALKALRPEIAANPKTLDRLKREISLSRRVTHPSVCRVYDFFRHRSDAGDSVSFFTMELLAGESLAHRLAERGPMQPAEALPILRQVIGGLEAAHHAGVVHRDLKPANVMLVPQGDPTASPRAVLTDFGLARGELVNDEQGHHITLTASWAVVGTAPPTCLRSRSAVRAPRRPATSMPSAS